jgi:hypothetical protein
MPFEVQTEADIAVLEARAKDNHSGSRPSVLNVADLLALNVSAPSMLIEHVLPSPGATLMFGAPKSNKTLLAVQIGIAVASGHPLCDYYRVVAPGSVLMVEQDDPAGAASLKDILERSAVPVDDIPFFLAPQIPFTFGVQLIDWLEEQILLRGLKLVILDSYTALRGSRSAGIDIVKAEQTDLLLLDTLAKRTGCAILIIHHSSKGAAGLDWSNQAAGTFAMSAATEAQIHVSRFPELDSNARERLVRIRGRHVDGTEMVLRFRKETLDHEHLLEGGAAPIYPVLLQLQATFGTEAFSAKDISQATGVSRATAHRCIDRLSRAGALTKRSFGQYVIAEVRR